MAGEDAVRFPSVEFFQALAERVEAEPALLEDAPPSEAYCGIGIGESLYVLEFDGRSCAGVAPGGNPLDLDFVLAGSGETWRKAIESAAIGDAAIGGSDSLAALVEAGTLEIRADDDEGRDAARATLTFLQAFLAAARGLELQFS